MAKKDALQFYLSLGGKQLVEDIKTAEKLKARYDKRYQVRKRRPSPWQTLGEVNQVVPYAHGLRFACEHGWVELHWIAVDCVRVRLRTIGSEFPAPFSYAVSKVDWPVVPIEVAEGPQALEIRTPALVCRVGKRPYRLGLETPDGELICVDRAGIRWQAGGSVGLSMAMLPDEACYGYGERAFGLNLRGKRLQLWNADPAEYGRGTDPLHYSIPFHLGVHNHAVYGVFWDNTCRGNVDLGASASAELAFEAERGELRYYLFAGKDVNSVLSRYTELTGRIELPPLWSLGYHQSRSSHTTQAEVLNLAREFRQREIPCDAIDLDVHYMDGFRPFTWDRNRFDDAKVLISALHDAGFNLVAALNPAIKSDPQYATYITGSARNVFLKYPDGELLTAAAWPGLSHFPDFTNPVARAWWADEMAALAQDGIDGVCNDMGGPSVLAHDGSESLPDYLLHDNDGLGGDHLESHNIYGMMMGRSSLAAVEKLRSGRRQWNMIRAGFAGAQRYASSWIGSASVSDWEHLRLCISMTLNMGLSGAPMTGSDIGGLDGDAELFTRWLQAACLLPFFRSHAAEPWAFGQPYEVINRMTIQLRYQLLPYLYSLVAQCKEFGWPVVRPLFMAEYDNPDVRSIDDCYLLGDAILVAPVLQKGAVQRSLYLPVGHWYDFWTNELLEGGKQIDVTAPLERLPLFIRAGAVLPVWPEIQHANQNPLDTLTLRVYPGNLETVLYEDQGEGLEYRSGDYRWVYVTCGWEDSRLIINRRVAGTYEPGYVKMKLEVVGFDDEPEEVRVDRQGAPLWYYDDQLLELSVDSFKRIEIRRKPLPTDRTVHRRPW